MPALRRDLTILHHNDVVCPRDGGQPVSDHNYGFVFDELCHRTLDHRFVFGINIGGRLVQNDDRRVFQHGALRAMHLLLRLQNFIHLRNGRTDLRQRVNKVKRCYDRRCHTEREDNHRDKRFHRKRAVGIKQPAEGQDRQHLRWKERIRHGHAEL